MKTKIVKSLMVIGGTFLLALAVEMFILPYDLLSGGVAGIAVAVEPFLHLNETMMANGLVLILLAVGSLFLGKEFFINTVLSSLCYPVFTLLLEKYITVPVIDPLLAAFYGGILQGFGIGIVMRTGASTGGMDIPPLIINKLTGIKVSTLVLLTDGLTVVLGLFAYDLAAVLLGLITVITTAYAIDLGLNIGGSSSKSVQIISSEWEKIQHECLVTIDRGVTITDVTGGYTGQKRKMLLCVCSQAQYSHLLRIVQAIDPEAFIITTDAVDMHGEGFHRFFRF